MIEKIFRITCDWCGDEKHFTLTRRKNEALKKYADGHLLYEFIDIGPLADELILIHGSVFKNLMFCCEGCAEKWFEENPEYRSHYRLVVPKNEQKKN